MKDKLSIYLGEKLPTPLYIQLFVQLKNLIAEGVLKPDEKLPPIRKLAGQLGVNSITVVKAYKRLESEGLAYSIVGSGTYVASPGGSQPQLSHEEDEHLQMMEKGQVQVSLDAINLASSTPTPDLFPVDSFKMLINKVLDRDKGQAFGYHQIQGYPPLRESICRYLEKFSIKVLADDVHVISGAQQGIDIISKALIEYGDCVFVESPTYRGALEAFKSRGARIAEIPVQEDGIDLNRLEEMLSTQRPKFIYVMPYFQNPTGYSYSRAKKEEILQMARRYNTFIVEDDSLSELSFTGEQPLPLKALDTHQAVIYIKSFSKIFMPGLRLGFMVVPQALRGRVISAKHTTDISTSGLIQRTFDLYLRENIWEEHIEYMKREYKKRYQTFLETVRGSFPENVKYKAPEGGLHVWFELPPGYSDQEVYARCLKRGVLIAPGSLFYHQIGDTRHFRLSFAAVNSERIRTGVKAVGEILHQYLKRETPRSQENREYSPLL